jgi:hypothetical protein
MSNRSGKPSNDKDDRRGRRNEHFFLGILGPERSSSPDPRLLTHCRQEQDLVPLEMNPRSGKGSLIEYTIPVKC